MDSILKEFKVVFGLDSKPLENGIQKSENSLRSFGKFFGGFIATYFSYSIFKNIIQGYADFNSQLSNSLALTGGNVSEVSALGNAMKRFGGNTESIINSMKNLNKHMHDARFGTGALIEVSKKYGLSVGKYESAEKTILSLAKQMEKYDRNTKIAISSQLGLDEAMTRAFLDGGKELEKLLKQQKSLGTITQHDLNISNKFNNAILDLKDIFSALTRDLARVVVPIFSKIVSLFYSFVEYIRKHKVIVLGFFTALFIALTPILITLGKMAIASITAFAPFYAIVGVITAISLIFEDLYYYFMGWDSATGKLVEKFPIIKGVLEFIKPLVLGIVDSFNAIVNFLKEPTWDNFKNIFKIAGGALVEFIKKPFQWLMESVNSLVEKFPLLGEALKPVKIVVDGIIEAFKWFIDAITNFSLDNVLSGLKGLKDDITNFGSGLVDKINPINWFSSDKEQENSKEIQQKELNNLRAYKIPEAPSIPYQNSVINNSNANSNTYNISNNINQNITSATPKQLADGTNKIMINSINAQRQQKGAL